MPTRREDWQSCVQTSFFLVFGNLFAQKCAGTVIEREREYIIVFFNGPLPPTFNDQPRVAASKETPSSSECVRVLFRHNSCTYLSVQHTNAARLFFMYMHDGSPVRNPALLLRAADVCAVRARAWSRLDWLKRCRPWKGAVVFNEFGLCVPVCVCECAACGVVCVQVEPFSFSQSQKALRLYCLLSFLPPALQEWRCYIVSCCIARGTHTHTKRKCHPILRSLCVR